MKTFEVKVEKSLRLTEEDLNDILCSCFEGGCGYWACLDNSTEEWDVAREAVIEKVGKNNYTFEDVMMHILCNGGSIRLIDQEDDDQVFAMNMGDFLNGIGQAISEGFWDGEDICDVDGEVGDAIIQYAVFGELVYG